MPQIPTIPGAPNIYPKPLEALKAAGSTPEPFVHPAFQKATAVDGPRNSEWLDLYTAPGSLADTSQRTADRAGLPGTTPFVDPRLINPANSPMASAGEIWRGDINLPVGGHGAAMEDRSTLSPLEMALQQLRQARIR